MAGGELMPEATAPTGTGPRGDEPVKPGIDYRQVQQPVEMVKPWHLPNSGAASAAEELAHALKSFSNTAGGIGRQLSTQEGKAAGQKAGMNPDFHPLEGFSAVTARGQAYNAAGQVAYFANTQTAAETAIDASEQAYPHDPAGFQTQVQAIKDATLKEVPPLYQPEIQTMFDRRIEAGRARIQEQATKQAQADDANAYTSTQPERFRTAVRDAADLPQEKSDALITRTLQTDSLMLDHLVSTGTISKERAETEKANALAKITEEVYQQHTQKIVGNWIDTARKTEDIGSFDRALAAYVNDPNVSMEDKARAGKEAMEQRHMFEQQQEALHAPEVQALAGNIEQVPGQKEGRGAFGPQVDAQIEAMRTKGWISTEYARSLSDRAALNSAKGKSDDEATASFTAVWNGEAPKYDPKDPQAAKVVDTGFQTLVKAEGAAPGTPKYNALAVSTMQRTSVVPSIVRKSIIADIASGDPARAAAAARLQEQLYGSNPGADLYQDDAKAAARGEILARNLDAQMPPEQAYAMMRAPTDPGTAELELRKQGYTDAVKTATDRNPHNANEKVLQDKLDASGAGGSHWYGNSTAPVAPVAMRAEFEGLVQEFYTRTGDIKQAQDLAFQYTQKTWHTTEVNGKPEMMKWGPSAAETPMIRQGVAETVKAFGRTEDPSTFKLSPFFGTSATQGRVWHIIDADGNPLLDGRHDPVNFDKTVGMKGYAAKQKAEADAAAAAKTKAGEDLMTKDNAATAAIDLAHPTNPGMAGMR